MHRVNQLSSIALAMLLITLIPVSVSRADDNRMNSHVNHFSRVSEPPSMNQSIAAPHVGNNHVQNNYSPPPHQTITNTTINTNQQHQHVTMSQQWVTNENHERNDKWDHNHFYRHTTTYIPYYYFNYYPDSAVNQPNTDQAWISASNGYIPNNAIVYKVISGNPVYYCRVYYQDNFMVGILLPNDACYIEVDSDEIGFENYQVLISSY